MQLVRVSLFLSVVLILFFSSSWYKPTTIAVVHIEDGTAPLFSSNNSDRSGKASYYTVRRDVRRCASPMCGGYFVSTANQTKTRCSDGKSAAQCYVAEIDWSGETAVEFGRGAVVRGMMSAKTYPGFGKLGTLRVTESWTAASAGTPSGTFYRARDLGVRCITHPCETHEETKLNSTMTRKIAGVDLTAAGASEDFLSKAHEAMTRPEGIIVAGTDAPVRGPGGRAFTLKANQFYLREKVPATSEKPSKAKGCFKTGCSGIICADQEMMSTCEWKDEYECYRTARCERQANGKCGFTQTTELTSCIASKRK